MGWTVVSQKNERVEDINPGVWANSAEESLKAGAIEDALKKIDKAIEYSNNDAHYFVEKAKILYALGHQIEAGRILQFEREKINKFFCENPSKIVSLIEMCPNKQAFINDFSACIPDTLQCLSLEKKWDLLLEILTLSPLFIVSQEGSQLIYQAIEQDQEMIVEYLFDKGIYDTKIGNALEPAIFSAIRFQSSKSVALIIKRKPSSVNLTNQDGDTPLFVAIETGNHEAFVTLVENGADIFRKVNNTSYIFLAVQNNRTEIVRYLINKKVCIDEQDGTGNTLLIEATRNNNIDIVADLCNACANPNLRNNDNETALIIAVNQRHESIINLIMNKYPRIDLIDAFWASVEGANASIAEMFLNVGVDVNTRQKTDNATPLMHVAQARHWDLNWKQLWKLLLKHNANVNLVDKDGFTALMHATNHSWYFSDETEMIEQLINAGASGSVKSSCGDDVFSIAEQKGHARDTFQLLERSRKGY